MPRKPDPLDEIGLRFEVSLAEAHASTRPDDLDALRILAYAYTAAGRLDEAVAADRTLVERAPDRADFRYDLACSYALTGRIDDAFTELSRSLDLGFADGDHLDDDPDLAPLRKDARWPALRARVGRAPDKAKEKDAET